MLPLQFGFLMYFMFHIQEAQSTSVLIGRILSMGLMCGVLGINIGHELGHRSNRFERIIGELLLLSSLENHFLPYHNRGHHTNVGT
jgi:alkane 1-monooxygenase